MAKLVPAKCPSCGATVVVDPDVEVCKCEYCDNAFITTKAITNYTTNVHIGDNNTTINVEAEKKSVFDGVDQDNKITMIAIPCAFIFLAIFFLLMYLSGALTF